MNSFKSDRYYIFGAGNSAKLVKSILEKSNKEVISFLTSNSNIGNIGNTHVINLSDTNLTLDFEIPVIIGVFNREPNADMSFIRDYLMKKNFHTIISFFGFYQQYSSQIGSLYWLADKEYYIEHLPEYLSVKELFKEKLSIDIYDNMLSFLTDFDFNNLRVPDNSIQYFPADLNVWDGKGAFLDVGSYDLQTVIDAYRKFGKLDTVIAFEPDSSNISLIIEKIRQYNPVGHFILIPCGVWSKTEILKFSSGGGESSSINHNGDISIQCLAIDNTLFGIEPGYIKMDIEGAEYEALLGSKATIKKYKPSLAICLYHNPSHIFEIPLLIKSWNLDYEFFIRFHGSNLFETVLYCIQKR